MRFAAKRACSRFALKAELVLSRLFKQRDSQSCIISHVFSYFVLFSLLFIALDSVALDGVVLNGKLVVTGDIYVCDKATNNCRRACQDGDTQPGCVDCTTALSCSARTSLGSTCCTSRSSCQWMGSYCRTRPTCTSGLSCSSRTTFGSSCCVSKSSCRWSGSSCYYCPSSASCSSRSSSRCCNRRSSCEWSGGSCSTRVVTYSPCLCKHC